MPVRAHMPPDAYVSRGGRNHLNWIRELSSGSTQPKRPTVDLAQVSDDKETKDGGWLPRRDRGRRRHHQQTTARPDPVARRVGCCVHIPRSHGHGNIRNRGPCPPMEGPVGFEEPRRHDSRRGGGGHRPGHGLPAGAWSGRDVADQPIPALRLHRDDDVRGAAGRRRHHTG